MFGNKDKRSGPREIRLASGEDVQLFFESGEKVSSWNLDCHSGTVKKADFEDLNKATISFSDQDYYILAKDKAAFKNINSYILQEFGKKMFYIDYVKKTESLYATPEDRLKNLKLNSVFPGAMALRMLLEKHKKNGWEPPIGKNFVTGFLLPMDNSKDNILILFAANYDLGLGHMQIIPNVDKWKFTIDNYALRNKMFVQGENLPEDQIVLFDSSELISVFGNIEPYPIERQYFGIKESKIIRTAATAAVASAVIAGTYAAITYNDIQTSNKATQTINQSIENAKRQLIEAGAKNFRNIVSSASIDIPGVMERANQLSFKSSTQKITITRQESIYRVSFLLKSEADREVTMAAAKSRPLPDGCVFAGAFTNPTIQFLELKYVCKNNNAGLSSLYGGAASTGN